MAQLHWNSFSWKHLCFRLKQCLEYSFSALSLSHSPLLHATYPQPPLPAPPHPPIFLLLPYFSVLVSLALRPCLVEFFLSRASYVSEVFNITAYKCLLKIVMFNVSCSSLIPSSNQEISPTLYSEPILWLLICDLMFQAKKDVF